MGTFAVTGTASGIGAATAARLEADGHRVIGIDLHDADVVSDLSTAVGRTDAVSGVLAESGGDLAGLIPCAGVGGVSSAELKSSSVGVTGGRVSTVRRNGRL